MQYTRLGRTGLEVSRLCLGCLSFGDPDRGGYPWSLPADEAKPLFRQALEAGINFFDTADAYSEGTSEEITGRMLNEMADRDEVVVATKAYLRVRPGPNGAGLSRKAIMTNIDHSLRRLNMDYVDLYQIHRWDDQTPIEETLEALNDVVRSGKARYIGASSMWAWQFAKALHLQETAGWARFVSMQDHYNLLYREEEREMMPLCADAGIGLIPWSPLARGKLTRDWDETSERQSTDSFIATAYPDSDRHIVEKVAEIADRRGVSRAQVALAWVLSNPLVSAPIVGATKPHHLTEAIAAVDLELTCTEIAELEEHYTPRAVAGHE